ncbi:MAG: protein of unknown function with transrane region [Candidatus Taylorbacteria bacterium]|nr:protein of unknown function with transrane region [Candidatus Taylorbacteria bacterium]
MTKFQAILIAAFILFTIVGAVIFATFKGKNSTPQLPAIQIWGTFPSDTFNLFVQHLNISRPEGLKISYVQKSPEQFDKDFIETLARGGGPDAVLLPQEMVLKHLDKIVPIPVTVIPQRNFMDAYIQQAENYITSKGIIALPFSVDPLVMYWNRDSFTNAGIPSYPKYWDDFGEISKKLTAKDENSNIRKSALALGEFSNITHAREIFGSILMQAGNPVLKVVQESNGEGGFSDSAQSMLANASIQGGDRSNVALNFFIRYSNPADPDYSWNRALPQSRNAFLSGTLATYFGFASELSSIRGKNPNLNFDVAPFPQAKKGLLRVTYGKMYGFSIVRSAHDQAAALSILSSLVAPEALAYLSQQTYLPPVRRDLVAAGNADPYLANFYDSALISRAWLDPDAAATGDIFQEMVESVTSGRKLGYEAIKDADTKINLLISNI